MLCDASLLRQVLVNLVENALKYSPDGGRIELKLGDEPDSVRIAVSDEGLGIPPSEQEQIFEKFYRLDAEMTRGVGGSGLGLYISREIVTQMDGTLTVRLGAGRRLDVHRHAAAARGLDPSDRRPGGWSRVSSVTSTRTASTPGGSSASRASPRCSARNGVR